MNKECTITVLDECNCKIGGLDLPTRKILSKKFEFIIPGAQYLPSVRLGRWNGKTSYFSMGGNTYVNLLEDIVPIIDSEGYEITVVDNREYSKTFAFAEVSEKTFAHKTWPAGHKEAGKPIILRDYQIEATNKYLVSPQSMQEISTAAGKTLITVALSHSIEKYGRSIVIVPSKSLVGQTEEDYVNLGLDVGVYFGDRKDIGKKHTICTWQSLNNMMKATKNQEAEITIDEFLTDVVCVIADECHQVRADALKALLTGPFAKVPLRWGLTGTIPKSDFEKIALLTSIGPVTNVIKAKELQDKGVLSNCHVQIIQTQDDIVYKDYQTELKYLLTNEKRLSAIADRIADISLTGNTLVLLDRIGAGKILEEKLQDSVFVSGATKLSERKEEYDEIATLDNKIIIATYGVAAVGINLPRIFNIVLIEPGKSFVRVIQSIGRGLRRAVDKDFVQIYDISSNAKFSKRHLPQRKTFYNEAQYEFTTEKLHYNNAK